MGRFCLICFLCVICRNSVFAQQDPQFTLSYTNQMFFNPAAIGSRNAITATTAARFQWNGLKGAPITWVVGLDMPFLLGKKKQNMIGFGILGYGDYIGYDIDGGLRFGLNYRRMKLGPGDLSFGIDMGIASKRLNNAVWITPSGQPDSSLPASNAAGEAFDFGLGLQYAGDNFYAGISVTHVNSGRIAQVNHRFAPHMYFNGGGFIAVGATKKWRINPNAMIRTDFATMNFDVGLNALHNFNDKHAIIFGTTYRYIDAVCFNIGYSYRFTQRDKVAMFLIQYNYDINTSRLNSFNSGSNEIVLRFCFPSKYTNIQRAFF